MSKVTVQIGFYLENQHYAQMQAFLPRTEAVKIPQLKVQERPTTSISVQPKGKKTTNRGAKDELSKSQKSNSKKVQSEEEINQEQINEEEDQNANQMENQQDDQVDEDQVINEDEHIIEDKIQSEKQDQNLMDYLEDEEDSQDEEDDMDDDISSLSRSMSGMKNAPKTKRQKGERLGLMELPDRRPRKDKKTDEATQIIRRQQKQRKRKQYLKKQVQAQQKATLDKILNQTGRKLKLKEQKQTQDQKRRDEKQLKSLGQTSKLITIEGQQGRIIMLHRAKLFSDQMTRVPQVKIKPECSKCGSQDGRYKIKKTNLAACSLNCYKLLV